VIVLFQIGGENGERLPVDIVDDGGGEQQSDNPPTDMGCARRIAEAAHPSLMRTGGEGDLVLIIFIELTRWIRGTDTMR
jgi:hypothetical protein